MPKEVKDLYQPLKERIIRQLRQDNCAAVASATSSAARDGDADIHSHRPSNASFLFRPRINKPSIDFFTRLSKTVVSGDVPASPPPSIFRCFHLPYQQQPLLARQKPFPTFWLLNTHELGSNLSAVIIVIIITLATYILTIWLSPLSLCDINVCTPSCSASCFNINPVSCSLSWIL